MTRNVYLVSRVVGRKRRARVVQMTVTRWMNIEKEEKKKTGKGKGFVNYSFKTISAL